MKLTKILVLGLLAAVVFLFSGAGCKKSGSLPEEAASSAKSAKKEVLEPLKLVYTLKNFGPKQELTATFWFEEKKQCGSREAYLGLMKLESDEPDFHPMFAKTAIFVDNGEMAVSKFVTNEEDLAFDDLTSQLNEFNIPLAYNNIFAYAGKNFNAPEVWESTAPIILKDVDSGTSISDYSLIRQTEDSAGLTPCQKFKLIVKGTSMDGFFNSCVAKQIGKINLPFIVSLAFANEQGPSWALKSYASEKSGIAWTPQCLESVKCQYVAQPSESARRECGLNSGQMETIKDEKGCVKEQKCVTQKEIVEQSISRTQRPGCSINSEVKKKLLNCRKKNQPNFDVTRYDENGCSQEIVCRP